MAGTWPRDTTHWNSYTFVEAAHSICIFRQFSGFLSWRTELLAALYESPIW